MGPHQVPQYGGQYHRGGGYHHGPWDGPDDGVFLVPGLLPMLLVLWILYRWYALDHVVAGARTAGHDTVRARWDAAVARYAGTARSYAAFECDPAAVLHRPALADVTEPATSRFVDAFAEATALATDTYPGRGAGERFVAAAEHAERCWRAAVDAADRVRAARFAPGERALIDQTLALLALARSSPHEAERRSAYERARRRLADLERRTGWAMPLPADELIATRARGMLDAA
jgi:hypothetical protein